jgi:Tfp pilus assembly protein FimT
MKAADDAERSRKARRARTFPSRGQAGFTAIEMIAVVVIGILMTAVAAPYVSRIFRRQRLMTVVREIESLVLASRMQAVRRNQQVVLKIDPANHAAWNWADVNNDFTQNAGEPTINQYTIPDYVFFRQAPNGAGVNSQSAVAFDTYNGNTALVDMVVFQGNGTIIAPQNGSSQAPSRPSPYTAKVPHGSVDCSPRCRGIYIADSPSGTNQPDRNCFRISVDDLGSTGRVSLLKWLPASRGANGGEVDYVPPPWEWYANR